MTQTATGDEIPATHGKQPALADEINNNRRSEMTIDGKSVASKGLGGTALGLGIGALGVELLNGGLNGILGWGRGNNAGEVAAKDSEIALLKSERFTDAKILEASNVLLGRIQNIEARLGAIDVQNQATQDAIVQVKNDLCMRLANEADKRECNDNATFYPKMVANVTTGTDTTAQSTYNPIPNCGCNGRAA